MRKKYTTVDEYLKDFEGKTLERLLILQNIITQNFPKAEKVISYNIPAFKIGKKAVFIAGYSKHVSIYPVISDTPIDDKITEYKKGRGTLQFPHSKDLPVDLIKQIVNFMLA